MGNEFMKENLLYITIHDSGIMEEKAVKLFEEKTELYFQEYGIKPMLKIKELGKE